MTRVIQLIETYEKRGEGTKNDPVRQVMQLFTLDGKLVVEFDSYKKQKGGKNDRR
ncbi:hypothetical protein LCGC14_2419580 [marine sediment metagenome]|uniref:Uncharacterized protein n=1 Tax=marine sediment metagenome TaxID=412755 RepID=A0A0F9CC95_9ZZZZ